MYTKSKKITETWQYGGVEIAKTNHFVREMLIPHSFQSYTLRKKLRLPRLKS